MATPSPTTWRPCCGACRGEQLVLQACCGAAAWRCKDCGSTWDGSELTVAEAAERGPAPAPPETPPESKAALRGD